MRTLAAHDHDVTAFGPLEWILVGVAFLGAVWVIWRAVALTMRPDENDPDHIKRSILDDDGNDGC